MQKEIINPAQKKKKLLVETGALTYYNAYYPETLILDMSSLARYINRL